MRMEAKRNYIFELEEGDDDLLSQVAEVEAQVLSSKRRRTSTTITTTTSNLFRNGNGSVEFHGNPKEDAEGIYMAALKGSAGNLTSKEANGGGSKFVIAGNSGVDSCFKCGKSGHWARDCKESAVGGGEGYYGKVENDTQNKRATELRYIPFNDHVSSFLDKACPCGLGVCLVLTANTEKNRGRKFYKCPLRQEIGGCSFFEWCSNASGNNEVSSVEQGYGSNCSFPVLLCPCAVGYCKIRTARRGKNIGQQFYCCPADQASSCGFFKWCNEQSVISTFQGKVSEVYNNNNRSSENKESNVVRSGSSCIKCDNNGHWAQDCSVSSSSHTPADFGGKSSSSFSTGTYYNCGKPGHWARDCSTK